MEDENDLRRYVSVLWRRKTLIAGVAVAAFILSMAVNVWQQGQNKMQVSILIQPAKNTGNLYSSADAIIGLLRMKGVMSLFLERAGVSVDLVESQHPLVSVTANKLQGNGGVVLVTAVATAGSLAEAKKVAEALAAGVVEEGKSEVAYRRQVLKESLAAITLSASAFSRLSTINAPSQPPADAKAESDVVIRALTLGALAAPTNQGLYSNAFQAEKDLALQLADVQPPRILSGLGVSRAPSLPLGQIGLMSAILGVAIGVVFAFIAEYAAGPRQALTGPPASQGVNLPQHGE